MNNFDPIILWIFLALAVALLVFLPNRGIRARWKEYQRARQAEAMEDALKYMFTEEQNHNFLKAGEIARRLKQPPHTTRHLLERMLQQQLVHLETDGYHLSTAGEKIALQIVRAHRLWERYLADEALMPLKDVHQHAHRREHGMSPAQVAALDAALGHPLTDPHGDPIPNAAGNFRPNLQGRPLPEGQPGQVVTIIHLEDEPPLAYAQILAIGLQVGRTLRIVENNATRLVLTDGIEEYILAPQVAANVFVDQLTDNLPAAQNTMVLGDLADNQRAEITHLSDQCQGFTRRRFLDLGFTPGTEVYPELQNSFGDPRAYRVRGTLIALRKEQAGQIYVRPLKSE